VFSVDNRRIAKNTIMLYFRMLITMLVSIYTSRVVLLTLGVDDYGIYNVMGGVVALISVLNSSMGAATSRFLIYELGRSDYPQLKKVFNATLASHLGIAIVVVLIAETLGLWFVSNQLVIPVERMGAALWAYQFSIFTTVVNLAQVPYDALIIAHEKMNVYAYISIISVTLKLVIVFILGIGDSDRLKLYSTLVFCVTLFVALLYQFYCRRKFPESALSFIWDKNLFKKLLSFSVWELYSAIAGIGVGQGLNMLLNTSFGVRVNAARGLASTVEGQITNFGANFMLAVKPKIIKLFSENKIPQMMKLVFVSSKYSFFLTLFISLPLLLETHFVLQLWLKEVPDYTVVFCKIVLVGNLIASLQGPIGTSFHAVGKLKTPSLIGGTLYLSAIVISYFFLKAGSPPESVFLITIAVKAMVQVTELFLLKRFIDYSVVFYLKQSVFIAFLVMFISGIAPYWLMTHIDPSLTRFLVVAGSSVISVSLTVFFIGIDRDTKNFIINRISHTLRKTNSS
jgi:O-antigen/teichoic acid export membrane protein